MHKFIQEPAHCGCYRKHFGTLPFPLRGFEEGWNMPSMKLKLDLGSCLTFSGVDHYVLTYHVDGGSARRREHIAPMATRGAISLQAPGSGGEFSSEGTVEYAHLYFKPSLLAEMASMAKNEAGEQISDFFGLRSEALSRDIQGYLARMEDEDDPVMAAEMDYRAYVILLGAAALVRNGKKFGEAFETVDEDCALKDVVEFIEDNLQKTIRISDLSEICGMSPFHFSRVFKKSFGVPPATYIRNRRIDRALNLLQSSKQPFVEIAIGCGFANQAHMNKLILQATGLTPGAIRDL
ncbi:helix-turn-helix domain-containing protein [Leisingera sp. D0M16]|uniref:helix-turn-helix domain-containing protein n=1 Tax=Leisingera coralii TaxID=3351347 RepID=UPI003BA3421B